MLAMLLIPKLLLHILFFSCFETWYLDILGEALIVGYFEFLHIIDYCSFLVLSVVRVVHA